MHGGPGLSDYTAPLAAELEDAFGVIRYQQRGPAPSTTSGPFGIGRHVADAIAVLDAAGAGRAWVVGHSWGGHLAMHLAVRHPGRLLGLVIVDPLRAVPDGGASDMEQNLTERIRPELAPRSRELDERAMAGQGTEEALGSLAIVWPGYLLTPGGSPDAAAAPIGGVLRRDHRLDPGALRPANPGAIPARADGASHLRPGHGQPDPCQAWPRPALSLVPVPDREGLRALPLAGAPRIGRKALERIRG